MGRCCLFLSSAKLEIMYPAHGVESAVEVFAVIIMSHSPGELHPLRALEGDWTVLGVGLGPLAIHKSLLWVEVPRRVWLLLPLSASSPRAHSPFLPCPCLVLGWLGRRQFSKQGSLFHTAEALPGLPFPPLLPGDLFTPENSI